MGRDRTKCKSFQKVLRDPRVTGEAWDEGAVDGIWVVLKSGYNFWGCSCLHEWNVKDLVAVLKSNEVTEGPTY